MYDFHIHTTFSPDGQSTAEEYCSRRGCGKRDIMFSGALRRDMRRRRSRKPGGCWAE